MDSGHEVHNRQEWEKACAALRCEIGAMRAASSLTWSDNDDGGSDAADERIREAQTRLAAIERMLAGREMEEG